MAKTDIRRYKVILEVKQAELAQVLTKWDDIAIDRSPDTLDEVQRAVDRELAIRNLDLRRSARMTQ
jgi:uncharacterized protein YfdQ (DUF2303 family)